MHDPYVEFREQGRESGPDGCFPSKAFDQQLDMYCRGPGSRLTKQIEKCMFRGGWILNVNDASSNVDAINEFLHQFH